jgi:E1A-binding protein p400
VLRPFLLRRLKADVEKQLPAKIEHVVRCRLSKRQRRLYEEYIDSGDTVRASRCVGAALCCTALRRFLRFLASRPLMSLARLLRVLTRIVMAPLSLLFSAPLLQRGTLASGNLLGIINCLMQLRKVCNHPDLFAGRPIISAFDCDRIEPHLPSLVMSLSEGATVGARAPALAASGLLIAPLGAPPPWAAHETRHLQLSGAAVEELMAGAAGARAVGSRRINRVRGGAAAEAEVSLFAAAAAASAAVWRRERLRSLAAISAQRALAAAAAAASPTTVLASPSAGASLRALLSMPRPADAVVALSADPSRALEWSPALRSAILTPVERAEAMTPLIEAFVFAIPRARAPPPTPWCSAPAARATARGDAMRQQLLTAVLPGMAPLQPSLVRRQVFFPDRRLIQFDCGKLQELSNLLRTLKAGGHKALIFTQMTRMLDILEAFLNLYGYTYCRLDGSTKPEQRQILMQRFNTDPRLFCFILSTRSGGFGINLVGADTVIFYDSDWNPAMDAQAQDRCHRIGQTRQVHIYRLVCDGTIEENILKKATQKRQLDWMAIQSGGFSTEFFTQGGGTAGGAPGGGAAAGGSGAIDPRDFFEGMPGFTVGKKTASSANLSGAGGAGASGSGAGRAAPTAAELEAAMRSAEDDADAALAAAAERENAAEVAEFNEDVRPTEEGADDDDDMDKDGGGGDGAGPSDSAAAAEAAAAAAAASAAAAATAAAAAAAAEEDEMLADVAKVTAAASRAGGRIEDALSAVERYALRFVEAFNPPVLPEAVTATVAYEERQWEMEQLERAKAAAEAAADEDGDPLAVEDWDATAATAAYRTQVARAKEQAERDAQEAAAAEAEEAAWQARHEAQKAAAVAAAAAAAAAAASGASAAMAAAAARGPFHGFDGGAGGFADDAGAAGGLHVSQHDKFLPKQLGLPGGPLMMRAPPPSSGGAGGGGGAKQHVVGRTKTDSQLSALVPPQLTLKVKLGGVVAGAPAGGAGAGAGAPAFASPPPPTASQLRHWDGMGSDLYVPPSAAAELGTSRAGRKRKPPQRPGGEDELLLLPTTWGASAGKRSKPETPAAAAAASPALAATAAGMPPPAALFMSPPPVPAPLAPPPAPFAAPPGGPWQQQHAAAAAAAAAAHGVYSPPGFVRPPPPPLQQAAPAPPPPEAA